MAEFRYDGIDDEGHKKSGNIIAETKEGALEQLKSAGVFPIKIEEANALNRDLDITIGNPVKPRDLSVFCRQFVSMLSAGVTVITAVEMLSQQTANKYLKKALKDVQKDIMSGETLSSAMAKQPKVFPDIMVNMIAAGEASGKMEIAFERMAGHFEKAAKTKAMVKKAAMYPIMVAIVAVIVVAIMLIKVIPSYITMFESMDAELPGITLAVIAMSDFLVANWYFILAAIIIIVVGMKAWHSTEAGQLSSGNFKIKAPFFGDLNVKTQCSLMARTLSTLVYSGLPLVEGITIVSKTMQNAVFKKALLECAEDVKMGISFSKALDKTGIFPAMVIHMTGIGEETGEIEDMLEKMANYYDEEVEMATQTVMAAMEPMIILVMAVLVIGLIAAVMAPMISMYSNLGSL